MIINFCSLDIGKFISRIIESSKQNFSQNFYCKLFVKAQSMDKHKMINSWILLAFDENSK